MSLTFSTFTKDYKVQNIDSGIETLNRQQQQHN